MLSDLATTTFWNGAFCGLAAAVILVMVFVAGRASK